MTSFTLLAALLGGSLSAFIAGGASMAPAGEDRMSAAPSYESLAGFEGIVINQINRVFGTEKLPAGNGFPVEPGVYVAVGQNQLTIFDGTAATLNNGLPTDTAVAEECRSGCSRVLYDAFNASWLKLRTEAARVGDEVPLRVLIGVESSLPARALLEAAYAASETRAERPPRLTMLLNGGQAGLRGRPFYLVPPEGLRVSPSSNPLGMTLKVLGGGRYELSSIDGRSIPRTAIDGTAALNARFLELDRRFPSKNGLIVEFADGVSVGELVEGISAAEDRFPIPILSMGAKVRIE